MRKRSDKSNYIERHQIDHRVVAFLPNFYVFADSGTENHDDIPYLSTADSASEYSWIHATVNPQKESQVVFTHPAVDTIHVPVYLDELIYNNKVLKFDKGLELKVDTTFQNGLYSIYDRKFGIYGSGKTRDDALRDYSGFFIELYEDIMSTPEEELPQSTRKFKNTLQCFATLENGS